MLREHSQFVHNPCLCFAALKTRTLRVFVLSPVTRERNTHERRCVIQFNVSRNALVAPGQALGTAMRNHAVADHPDSGGAEGARGWPGQPPPGWDLSEQQFESMCRDLGFATAEDYVRYKATTSVRTQPKL